jgi:K+-transporting ATPase ATPase A chain
VLQGFVQIGVFFAIVVALAPLLGRYMARVFGGERVALGRVVRPLERTLYRVLRVDPEHSQGWKAYATSLLAFSFVGFLLLYLILRTQSIHPGALNPQGFHSATWDVSFNTVSSFVTNTNWQFYGGETTMTYLSQMAGLAVQNFLSAAVGIAVLVALIRALAARGERTRGAGDAIAAPDGIGSFWVDITRATLYVLAPLSIAGALVLASQGVLQDFSHYLHFTTVTGAASQLPGGPVASQIAIKMLGTNGGGFFNVNSAMPFENPSAFTNWVEMGLMFVIPASLPFTYGRMVANRRQGVAIFGVMLTLLLVSTVVVYVAEQHGTPAQHLAGVSTHAMSGSAGGNLEGKEQRFGIASTSAFTALTTVISCGAVNAALESFTGIGGLVPFADLAYGESVFGGVGTGLYTMLLYVLLAVFLGGLMVGRTPEYLGKKLAARDIKLVTIGTIVTPFAVLVSTTIALATKYGRPSVFASGPQGFSETLYAYMSQANNNGSALAGFTGYVAPNAGNLGAHGITFADLLGGVTMLFGRYVPILVVLAIAGSLVTRRVSPAGLGTMRTDTPTFAFMLGGVVILVGALTFFPALLLGPVVQGLTTRLF